MASSAERGSPAGGRRVFVPIAIAAFITSLDSTVVATAQPSIMRDLHLTLSGLEWVATGYLLSFASLLLAGGRLTDLAGRRRVLLLGLALFGVASVLVATAPGIELMLAGRALQGAGAALVMPAVLAVLAADLDGQDRHLGAGICSIAIAAALALGPFTGGVISQYLRWTYIFWLNLPVVLLGAASARWAIPPSSSLVMTPDRVRPFLARLDLPGMTLATITLGSLTLALIEGQRLGYGSAPVLISLLVAAVTLPLAVVAAQNSTDPLLPLDLLRHRVVLGACAVQILWGLGVNGVFFFTSIFLQQAMGFTPSASGLAFVPLAAALVLVVPMSAQLAARWGAHRIVGAGMVVVAAGLAAITVAGPGDGLAALLPGLVLIGAGSAATTPLTSAVMERVPQSRAGLVSAVISVSREVSGVLGIAVMGSVLTLRQTSALDAGATAGGAFAAGYRTALLTGAALAVLGGLIALRSLRPGPDLVTQVHPPARERLPA